MGPAEKAGRALKVEPSPCQCKCGCRTKPSSSGFCVVCGRRVCSDVCARGGPYEAAVRCCHVCRGEEAELDNEAGALGTTMLRGGSCLLFPFAENERNHVPLPSPPRVLDARIGRIRTQFQGTSACDPCPQCGRACVGDYCAPKGEFCTCKVPHKWRSRWPPGQQAERQPVVPSAAHSVGHLGTSQAPCWSGSSTDPSADAVV